MTSMLTEYLRDQRAIGREREARVEARRLHLLERRASFQRETLLNLQEEVMQLARAAGRMDHLDKMEYRKTGEWGKHLFPEDLDEGAREAGVKTLMLMVRVRDDVVRDMVKKFRDHANAVGICRSETESRQALDGMTAVLGPLHERIGMILRKLDDDEGPPI